MGMVDAVKLFLKRYTDFQGRSSRSEFWWVYLATYLAVFAALIVMAILTFIWRPLGMLAWVVLILGDLAIIIPSFALVFRRLHDTDRSAWWIFIGMVPLLGAILLIVWYCTKGTTGPNRFGPDPLAGTTPAEVFA